MIRRKNQKCEGLQRMEEEQHIETYAPNFHQTTPPPPPSISLFRPISLMSVVCKVLETVLREKLISNLDQLYLQKARQHGSVSL